MCTTLFVFRKRQSRMLATTSTSCLQQSCRLLFIADRATKQQFLVDWGASVSVYPASARARRVGPTTTMLAVANGTTIRTYGNRTVELDISLGRPITWTFIVADVQQPFSVLTSLGTNDCRLAECMLDGIKFLDILENSRVA